MGSPRSKTKKREWNGPALIVGLWGNKVMVGFGDRIFTIANENLISTKKVLEIIGSNENLQLHTMGTPIPLFTVVDSKSFVFLMRYRQRLVEQIKPTIRTLELQTLNPFTEFMNDETRKMAGNSISETIGSESNLEFEAFCEGVRQEAVAKLFVEERESLNRLLNELQTKVKLQLKTHRAMLEHQEWKLKNVQESLEPQNRGEAERMLKL